MSQQPGSSPRMGAANPVLNLPGLEGDPNDPALLGGPSTPWWRRRKTITIAAIILLAILLLAILLPILNRKPATNYRMQHPNTDTLAITVSATGPLNSAIYNVTYSGEGTIAELDATVGQKVKKGQTLAILDKTSLQDAYNQAQAAVAEDQATVVNAQKALTATQASANASNTAAQTTLNGSQNNKNANQSVSQATIDADQTAVDNAQDALDEAQSVYNTTVSQAQAQLNSDLNSCHTSVTATATAKTPTATSTNTSSSSSSNSGSSTAFTSTSIAFGRLIGNDTCESLAQSKYNSSVASAKSNLQTAQNNYDTAQKTLATDRANANKTNTSDQGTVNNNQASVNTTKASGNVSVQTAQANLTTALNNLKTDQLKLEQAKHNLDDATIKAPHDGTITTVNGTVGSTPGTPPNASNQSTTTSNSTFVQVVDTADLQVVANVNETDTANLKIGDSAQFTVNSYGDRTFNGTISSISPNGQTSNNVVTYPVYIDVDKNNMKGTNLYPGMTANVTITVLQRNDVLLIPVDAVNFARQASSGTTSSVPQLIDRKSANAATTQARKMLETLKAERDVSADSPNASFVIVRNSTGQYSAKPVVVGLNDGTNYEVLDGLTTQDNVVIGTSSTGGTMQPSS